MIYLENLIISQASCLAFVLQEKRGGLWMVRYSLYRGGRRLIHASDKFCVCGQEFMIYKGSAWAPAFAGAHASGRAGRHSDEEMGKKL